MQTVKEASLEEVSRVIFDSGAVEIRDVDGGQEPFVYSTGNRGPGYLQIKGLVGQRGVLKYLTGELAKKVAPLYENGFNFVNGNATGGMVPAWQLTDDIERTLGLDSGTIPYTYLRGSRKEGGHGELITGDKNNSLIHEGMSALIVEELVNFAGTTTNAAKLYREVGYPVSHAACIFHYDNPQANDLLKETEVTLTPLITLPQFLDVAEADRLIPQDSIDSYRNFLKDPLSWQLRRDLVVPAESAKKAQGRGITMIELDSEEAIDLGAPEGKIREGVIYWRPH